MPGERILIIEDEAGIVLSLEDRLRIEGYSVESRMDGLSGEKTAAEGVFDCIILDIMLPGRDGFQICRNLRENGIDTPVLMLTARNTNLDTIMGLRIGADDYLGKPFDMAVLLARLEALIRRSHRPIYRTAAGQIRFGDFILDRTKRLLRQRDEIIALSLQEYRLLEFFLLNPGRVIGREELLDAVWGYETMTTTRTIDVHVAQLRKKIEKSGNPVFLQTVRGFGYKFMPEE